MNSTMLPVVIADLFDRLRLQLPDPIVNWLTPVWILCVGAAAGLILTAVIWGILWLLSRVPGIGSLAEQPTSRRVAVAVLAVVFFSIFAGMYFRVAPHPVDAVAEATAPARPVAATQINPVDHGWALAGCLV